MSPYLAISGVFPVLVAGMLFALFSASLFHKIFAKDEFVGVLADYRILPRQFLFAGYLTIVLAETVVCLGTLSGPSRSYGLALSALLLVLYGLAIAVNLVRGRSEISCGCGSAGETIAWWMVLRNCTLAALAIGCLPLGGEVSIPLSAEVASFALGVTATILAAAAVALAQSTALHAPLKNGNAGGKR